MLQLRMAFSAEDIAVTLSRYIKQWRRRTRYGAHKEIISYFVPKFNTAGYSCYLYTVCGKLVTFLPFHNRHLTIEQLQLRRATSASGILFCCSIFLSLSLSVFFCKEEFICFLIKKNTNSMKNLLIVPE